MTYAKIKIVEDKTIVAEDCSDCLESLGYKVSSVVASGEESIEKAMSDWPDAVLMGIHLRDKMDGIDAAGQIYTRFEIPVVLLSATLPSPLRSASSGPRSKWRFIKQTPKKRRRQAQKELKNHRDHLEELVEARTFELSAAKEHDEVANQAISFFGPT